MPFTRSLSSLRQLTSASALGVGVACGLAVGIGAQPPRSDPYAPICAEGQRPRMDSIYTTATLVASTGWNGRALSADDRRFVLFYADAIRQHFVPPATLGYVPLVGEYFPGAGLESEHNHSAFASALVLIVTTDGHVRDRFWQFRPSSAAFADALVAAVQRADDAGDLIGIPPLNHKGGDDTLIVNVVGVAAADEGALVLLRARLASYLVDEGPNVLKAARVQFPGGLAERGKPETMQAAFVIGADGKVIESTLQLTQVRWREMVQPLTRTVLSTKYQPGRSGGCSVPVRVAQPFSLSVDR
jgi:hypothetical protein